ncbi:MAG: tRNA/rRNA methyltransferase [Alphaproteobacteria bacterium]|nr:tRNA/rRNA methyltransferase [Alphaproteobacteria bacterium]
MPGAGTDKTRTWADLPGPIVILVEPQLGENIGAAARAMGNFGLKRLRVVKPRQGWPNPKATVMAAGADAVLESAQLFDTVEAAIADCTIVLAATARAHDQAKPVVGADEAARLIAEDVRRGEQVAILFGRERNGLENEEVALADRIITLPVNPAFASLNLAQAVVIIGYEYFKHVTGCALPFDTPKKSPQVGKQQLAAFFATLERELEKVEFFRPPEKRATMTINLRNIFNRMKPTQQDVQTLHGVVTALVEGRKGPAKGGILTGDEAQMLRTLLAERGGQPAPIQGGPARGLARLLRRNPTDIERAFWEALVKDRRFAGHGFKRQIPIGPHICDFVSLPLRSVIELVPKDEPPEASAARAERRAWLEERNYTVIDIAVAEAESDIAGILHRLSLAISKC